MQLTRPPIYTIQHVLSKSVLPIFSRTAVGVALVSSALLGVSPSVAQADQIAPLVMLKGGDIWEYSGDQLIQVTTHGYHKRPVMSPNGQYVAYNFWCDESITAVKDGVFVAQGDLPGNMGLLRLNGGTTEAIATQPTSITFAGEIPNDAIVRSAPAWSPDSSKIAWTEIRLNQYVYSLVIYDLATKQATTVVAELPAPLHLKELNALDPQWGDSGIALFIKQKPKGEPLQRAIHIYDAQGGLISMTPLIDNFYDFMWINDNGAEKLAILFASQPWALMNPVNGAFEIMNGVPELYSPVHAEYSVAIEPQKQNDQIVGFKWMAKAASTNVTQPLKFAAETNFAARITISAQGVAWASDAVYIWDGDERKVNDTDQITRGFEDADSGALAWSPVAWRVRR